MLFSDYIQKHPFNPVRLAVRVRQKAIQAIREGHPWLFEDSIEKISKEGRPGDVAVVFDSGQKFLAAGLYDPVSELCGLCVFSAFASQENSVFFFILLKKRCDLP